jgi:DedD protein
MGLITEDRATESRATDVASERGGLGRSRAAIVDDEQEITLGTRSLLGVFFGLVLVCGIFFGLGYSVGRSGGTHLASPDVPGSNTGANANLKKPSAQQSLTPAPEPATPSPSSDDNTASSSAAPEEPTAAPKAAAVPVAQPVAQPVTRPAPAPVAQSAPLGIPRPAPPVQRPADLQQQPSVAQQRPATVQSVAAAMPSTFMVQIAAVRLQQDANVLVGALQRRGYHVVVRNETQDALLHVQLGPFNSRAEANDMRARLLADGYNAVVK